MKNIKNALAKPAGSASLPWAIWTWNGSVTKAEVESQLNALIAKGFGGVAIRPGRDMVPVYMSREFLDNFGAALEIARQHKIGVRLADDFSLVWDGRLDGAICRHRALRAEYLVFEGEVSLPHGDTEVEIDLDPKSEYMAQAVKKPSARSTAQPEVRQVAVPAGKNAFRWKAPSQDWRLLLYRREYAPGPAGYGVPNVLNQKAVQNYMQDTLEVVKSTFSKYVPSTFEGFVTEMPALRPGGNAIYWDDDIAVKYKSRYKREFFPQLPSLFIELPGAERTRAHLYAFMYDLMAERFAAYLELWAKKYRLSQWVLWPEAGVYKPENALCDGHITPHPGISSFGLQNLDGGIANFALMRTAADINTNQYRREVLTVIGRNRTGAGSGLQELRREVDASLLAGPSRIIMDGIYMNVEQRNNYKTPCNISWHTPDWEFMSMLCTYSTRAKDMITGLQASKEIAVLTPSDCVMGAYMPGSAAAENGFARFRKTVDALCRAGKGFDILTEELLVSCALRQNGEFATADRIRKGNYQALIVPYAPLVSRCLLVYLEKLAIKGTPLIFIDEAPEGTFEDGVTPNVSLRIQKVVAPRRENVFVIPAAGLESALGAVKPEISLLRENGESAEIGAQVYYGEGGKLYVLHNMLETVDQTAVAEVQIEKHFAALDILTGEFTEIEPVEADKNMARLRLAFSPLQTMFIVATPVKMSSHTNDRGWNPYALPLRSYRIIFKEQWEFEPLSPNVLPLSNWNVRMGLSLESKQISHFYESKFEARELPGSCMFVMNGLSRSPAPYQGIEITFNGVRIDGKPLDVNTAMMGINVSASAAGASGDCGTKPQWQGSVPAKIFEGKTQCFEIGDKITKGMNSISIRTTGCAIDPQTLVYQPLIVGNFAIVKGAHGLAIDKTGITANHDSWTKHGYPYMSGRARYLQTFEVPNDYDKLVLRFSSVSGTVRVNINDVDVGMLHWAPMEIDVTQYCNVQRNRLAVEVVNSIDNTLRLGVRPSGLTGEVYIDVYRS